jgi:hypothetical protein
MAGIDQQRSDALTLGMHSRPKPHDAAADNQEIG